MDVFVYLLKLLLLGCAAGLVLAVAYPLFAAFDCAVAALSRAIAYRAGRMVGALTPGRRRA